MTFRISLSGIILLLIVPRQRFSQTAFSFNHEVYKIAHKLVLQLFSFTPIIITLNYYRNSHSSVKHPNYVTYQFRNFVISDDDSYYP